MSKQLKKEDVDTMAQLVVGQPDFPGERDIEKVEGDALKFFVLLEKHGLISEIDYDLLLELLEEVNRMDLVKTVQDKLKVDIGKLEFVIEWMAGNNINYC